MQRRGRGGGGRWAVWGGGWGGQPQLHHTGGMGVEGSINSVRNRHPPRGRRRQRGKDFRRRRGRSTPPVSAPTPRSSGGRRDRSASVSDTQRSERYDAVTEERRVWGGACDAMRCSDTETRRVCGGCGLLSYFQYGERRHRVSENGWLRDFGLRKFGLRATKRKKGKRN